MQSSRSSTTAHGHQDCCIAEAFVQVADRWRFQGYEHRYDTQFTCAAHECKNGIIENQLLNVHEGVYVRTCTLCYEILQLLCIRSCE